MFWDERVDVATFTVSCIGMRKKSNLELWFWPFSCTQLWPSVSQGVMHVLSSLSSRQCRFVPHNSCKAVGLGISPFSRTPNGAHLTRSVVSDASELLQTSRLSCGVDNTVFLVSSLRGPQSRLQFVSGRRRRDENVMHGRVPLPGGASQVAPAAGEARG